MRYRVMIIDDEKAERIDIYKNIFDNSAVDPIYVWNKKDFEKHKNTSFDAYFIDLFLKKNDWGDTNAAILLTHEIEKISRVAPIFFISRNWGDEALEILKIAGSSTLKVVQYISWAEMKNASANSDIRMIFMAKIIFELDRWYSVSGILKEEDDPVNILFLADVQFGDPSTDVEANFAEQWLATALREESLLPDIIVIAGDITHSGRPDQFDIAKERIENDIMGGLWGINNIDRFRDRLVLIPGNHDVNLRFSACDGKKFNISKGMLTDEDVSVNSEYMQQHHRYSYYPYCEFAFSLTGDRYYLDKKNILSLSRVDRRFAHLGIRFITLSTVAHMTAMDVGKIMIDENSLRDINRDFLNGRKEEMYTIAVSHHGMAPTGDRTSAEIENWQAFKDCMAINKVNLWAFGHYHKYNCYSPQSTPFDPKKIRFLQLPTLRIANVVRGFCLMQLKRKKGIVRISEIHHIELREGAYQKVKQEIIYEE